MMFDNSWSDAFAEYGIGAMAWETYNAGKPDEGERLCVIVPHPSPDPPYNGREWIHVYPMHAENNWAQPGPKNGWDGNREVLPLDRLFLRRQTTGLARLHPTG